MVQQQLFPDTAPSWCCCRCGKSEGIPAMVLRGQPFCQLCAADERERAAVAGEPEEDDDEWQDGVSE